MASQHESFSPPIRTAKATVSGLTGTSATVTFGTSIPKGATVVRAYVVCVEAFAAGASGVTDVDVEVGYSGDADAYLLSGAVESLTVGELSQLGGAGASYTGILVDTAERTPTALFTATGGNMEDVDGGVYSIHVQYIEGPR